MTDEPLEKQKCVTCSHYLDDPYECVNWLIWKGAPVPPERNTILRKIMDGTVVVPDLVVDRKTVLTFEGEEHELR